MGGPRPEILDTRAVAYMALELPEQAIKDLEEAVAVSPLPEIYVHLARAYMQAGRRDEAGRALEKANNVGLRLEKIHPLERDAYRQLLADLARKPTGR